MSFLESGKRRSGWITTLDAASIRTQPACVQCGSRLEIVDSKSDYSGKCFNCNDWVSDGDETDDELEY